MRSWASDPPTPPLSPRTGQGGGWHACGRGLLTPPPLFPLAQGKVEAGMRAVVGFRALLEEAGRLEERLREAAEAEARGEAAERKGGEGWGAAEAEALPALLNNGAVHL